MRSKVGLPNQTEGVIFTPIPCDVVYFEPERVGVNLLLDSLKVGDPTTRVLSSFEQVERYGKNLYRKSGNFCTTLTCVNNVIAF